jgi:acyl-[acyl-carrier-protein]-phospholipid O-acyltransferase/long-chain-fatty-acid--[acyl-carrier-protein] ligase
MQTNPLDARAVGENMEKYHGTILFGTPTFLNNYTRRCSEDNFKHLRLAIAGAEKLPSSTSNAFKEKFGIMPTEAYGTTELSPGVALNAPIKIWQLGKKVLREGSVGRPLPGIQVKTVDPDTMKDLPAGEMGLLLISSPGTMKGYLNEPERTKEVIRDGWYVSGDMAKVHKNGAIELTGRLSRFSKIAGEMVPHGAIEEAIHSELHSENIEVAVVGLPDASRGEKLIILHTDLKQETDQIIDALREQGLPNLWIPKAQNFKLIEAIPLLATGKLDLKGIKNLAEELEKQ